MCVKQVVQYRLCSHCSITGYFPIFVLRAIYCDDSNANALPVLLCCRTGIGPLMLLACTLWRIP